ncbi:hypothetical protein T439DRAFT_377777 [Meredithblackwellia eburnea MCA 4105]
MADLPSPTKRAIPAPQPAMQDPTDQRGTFARQASQHSFGDIIKDRAVTTRATFGQGRYNLPQPSSTVASGGRAFGATQSMPNLTFSNDVDIYNSVFSPPSRSRELQPMYESSDTDSMTGPRSRSQTQEFFFGPETDGFRVPRDPTSSLASLASGGPPAPVPRDGFPVDGDGFDLDQVFGDGDGDGDGQFGSPTQRCKRRHDEEEEEGVGEDEDEEMDTTDVEDEVSPEDLPVHLRAPIGRPLQTRRQFTTTQSMPASAFAGNVSF